MAGLAEKMSRFWENVAPRGAHLGLDGEEKEMRRRYSRLLTGLPLKGATVIDFGCGGGLLGEYLLDKRGVRRYVAYDVAERSIRHALERVRKVIPEGAPYAVVRDGSLVSGDEDVVTFYLLRQHRWDFAAQKPDVLVSLACIMHFPTLSYLDNFLRTADESGAAHLVLEVRHDEVTRFQPDPYSSEKAAVKACFTNEGYVTMRLPHYELVSEETEGSTRIMVYRRRGR